MAEDTLVHWLTLPLAEVLRWHLPEAFTRLILQGIPVTGQDASYRAGDLAAFHRWHADLHSGNEERQTTLLLEVQALVSTSTYGNAQRMTSGIDRNRLTLLLAVLEKRAGLDFSTHDVFASVAGGFVSGAQLSGLFNHANGGLQRGHPGRYLIPLEEVERVIAEDRQKMTPGAEDGTDLAPRDPGACAWDAVPRNAMDILFGVRWRSRGRHRQ